MTASYQQYGGVGEVYADNSTLFFPFAAQPENSSVGGQVTVQDDLTIDQVKVLVPTNTINASSTVTLQKNDSDTSVVITIGATATGVFSDLSNSVSVTAGDTLRFKVVTGTDASQSLTIRLAGFRIVPDTASITLSIFTAHDSGNVDLTAASTTTYFTPHGSRDSSATESLMQLQIRAPCTLREFYTLIGNSSRSTSTTVRTRVNGANGGQSIVYGSGENGFKQDTTGTDSLSTDDLFNYSVTTGSGSGSFQVERQGVFAESTNDKFFLMGQNENTQVSFGDANDFYLPIACHPDEQSAESGVQMIPEFDFTLSELIVDVSTNTKNLPSSLAARVGGVTGTLLVEVDGLTGLFIDSFSADDVTGGTDAINYIGEVSGTGDLRLDFIGVVGDSTGAGGSGEVAFPTVESVTATAFSSDTTAHDVNMPATVTSGDLLLMLFTCHTDETITTPAGWTEVYDQAQGGDVQGACYVKKADGTEGGTTVDVVTATAQAAAAQVYRITSWSGTVGEIEATLTGGLDQNPNPPSHTPSGGVDHYLWMTAVHSGDDEATVSAYPTGFSNGVDTQAGAGAGAGVSTASSRRESRITTVDPGVYTLSESERFRVSTISIPSGTSGGTSLEQEGFRWRDDDGSESAATWRQNQDVDDTVALDTNIRLRTLINASGDPASKQYQLEYRKVGDSTWKKVDVEPS